MPVVISTTRNLRHTRNQTIAGALSQVGAGPLSWRGPAVCTVATRLQDVPIIVKGGTLTIGDSCLAGAQQGVGTGNFWMTTAPQISPGATLNFRTNSSLAGYYTLTQFRAGIQGGGNVVVGNNSLVRIAAATALDNDIASLTLQDTAFAQIGRSAYVNNGIGPSGVVSIAAGTLLDIAASSGTFSGQIVAANGATVINSGGGGGVLLAPVAIDTLLNIGSGSNITLSGAITGTGTVNTLTVSSLGVPTTGSGTVTLQNAHTFVGDIVAGASTLTGLSGLLAGGNFPGNIQVATGKTFTSGSNSNQIFSGTISGAGGFAKSGTGTTTLTSPNTYQGTTAISAGTLKMGHAGAIGSGTITQTGGTLDLNGLTPANASALTMSPNATALNSAAASATLSNPITLTGAAGSYNFVYSSVGNSGSLTIASNIALSATGVILAPNAGTAGSHVVFNGVISGTGKVTGAVTASGTTNFNAANTYTGATTPGGNTFKAGVASVAGVSGPFGVNSAVVMANAATCKIDITGFDVAVGSLAGGGTTGGNITLGAATMTTGGDNTSTSYAAIISGTGGLTKTGTGIQTLTGANTYTGVTAVKAGGLTMSAATRIALASRCDMTVASSAPAAANSGTIAWGAAPAFAGRTINIIITESGSGIAWDAATWSGTQTGTPAIQLNGVTLVFVAGASTSLGGTTVTFDTTNKRIRVTR